MISVSTKELSRSFYADALAVKLANVWHNRPDLWQYKPELGIERWLLTERGTHFVICGKESKVPLADEPFWTDPLIAINDHGYLLSIWWYMRNMSNHGWVFLAKRKKGFTYIPIADGCAMYQWQIYVPFGEGSLMFGSSDPAWPWPALFPARCEYLLGFKHFLTPSDDNPLTKGLRSGSRETRKHAEDILARMKLRYRQMAEITTELIIIKEEFLPVAR